MIGPCQINHSLKYIPYDMDGEQLILHHPHKAGVTFTQFVKLSLLISSVFSSSFIQLPSRHYIPIIVFILLNIYWGSNIYQFI